MSESRNWPHGGDASGRRLSQLRLEMIREEARRKAAALLKMDPGAETPQLKALSEFSRQEDGHQNEAILPQEQAEPLELGAEDEIAAPVEARAAGSVSIGARLRAAPLVPGGSDFQPRSFTKRGAGLEAMSEPDAPQAHVEETQEDPFEIKTELSPAEQVPLRIRLKPAGERRVFGSHESDGQMQAADPNPAESLQAAQMEARVMSDDETPPSNEPREPVSRATEDEPVLREAPKPEKAQARPSDLPGDVGAATPRVVSAQESVLDALRSVMDEPAMPRAQAPSPSADRLARTSQETLFKGRRRGEGDRKAREALEDVLKDPMALRPVKRTETPIMDTPPVVKEEHKDAPQGEADMAEVLWSQTVEDDLPEADEPVTDLAEPEAPEPASADLSGAPVEESAAAPVIEATEQPEPVATADEPETAAATEPTTYERPSFLKGLERILAEDAAAEAATTDETPEMSESAEEILFQAPKTDESEDAAPEASIPDGPILLQGGEVDLEEAFEEADEDESWLVQDDPVAEDVIETEAEAEPEVSAPAQAVSEALETLQAIAAELQADVDLSEEDDEPAEAVLVEEAVAEIQIEDDPVEDDIAAEPVAALEDSVEEDSEDEEEAVAELPEIEEPEPGIIEAKAETADAESGGEQPESLDSAEDDDAPITFRPVATAGLSAFLNEPVETDQLEEIEAPIEEPAEEPLIEAAPESIDIPQEIEIASEPEIAPEAEPVVEVSPEAETPRVMPTPAPALPFDPQPAMACEERILHSVAEVCDELGVAPHVLRFWETRFAQIQPVYRGGARRYYRPQDLEIAGLIAALLHDMNLSIRTVQRILSEHGAEVLIEAKKRDMLSHLLPEDAHAEAGDGVDDGFAAPEPVEETPSKIHDAFDALDAALEAEDEDSEMAAEGEEPPVQDSAAPEASKQERDDFEGDDDDDEFDVFKDLPIDMVAVEKPYSAGPEMTDTQRSRLSDVLGMLTDMKADIAEKRYLNGPKASQSSSMPDLRDPLPGAETRRADAEPSEDKIWTID